LRFRVTGSPARRSKQQVDGSGFARPARHVRIRCRPTPGIRTVDWNPPEKGESVALEVGSDGTVRFDKSDPKRSMRKVKRLRKKGLA
jgi:hypothetical protein